MKKKKNEKIKRKVKSLRKKIEREREDSRALMEKRSPYPIQLSKLGFRV